MRAGARVHFLNYTAESCKSPESTLPCNAGKTKDHAVYVCMNLCMYSVRMHACVHALSRTFRKCVITLAATNEVRVRLARDKGKKAKTTSAAPGWNLRKTARPLPLAVYPTHHGVSPHTHTQAVVPCHVANLYSKLQSQSTMLLSFWPFISYFLFLYPFLSRPMIHPNP